MKLSITYYGNPVLRKKAQPVTKFDDELKQFAEDLLEIMRESNGMGIAAPQVSRSIALFWTAPPYQQEDGTWQHSEPKLYINSKVIEVSKEEWEHEEGCLSIPRVGGVVKRPVAIRVTYQDIEGNLYDEELIGWPARVFLHEYDHTNGVLFIDRMPKKERKKLEATLQQIKKNYIQ